MLERIGALPGPQPPPPGAPPLGARQRRIFGAVLLRPPYPGLAAMACAMALHGALGQSGVTTLGIQLKPVVPVSYFDPVSSADLPHLRGRVELQGGVAFGMSVRVGLSSMLSLESGIGQIQRRYGFTVSNDTAGFEDGRSVKYVGYEIPMALLVHLRLGERSWMNTSLGASLDFYPSDIEARASDATLYVYRSNWAQAAALGNVGVEWRTDKAGTFYLGATYHRPFNAMSVAELTWTDFGPVVRNYRVRTALSGTYLTLDLRYYFHEDPDKQRLRRQRNRD
jgi:hypothetical protein